MPGELGAFAARAIAKVSGTFLTGGLLSTKASPTTMQLFPPVKPGKGMESRTKAEKQIYDLISRRFIGMFYPDRDVLHQDFRKITIDGRTFLSIGEKEVEAGWSSVDTSKRNSVPELPELRKGDRVRVTGMRLRTDQTKAPAPHTEASLLAAMEHAGENSS